MTDAKPAAPTQAELEAKLKEEQAAAEEKQKQFDASSKIVAQQLNADTNKKAVLSSMVKDFS
jgi:hypothetical protein